MYYCIILYILLSETTFFLHHSRPRGFFYTLVSFPCPQVATFGNNAHRVTDLIHTDVSSDSSCPHLCVILLHLCFIDKAGVQAPLPTCSHSEQVCLHLATISILSSLP